MGNQFSRSVDFGIIDRYLAGEATPDEIQQAREALGDDLGDQSPGNVLRTARRSAAGLPVVDVDGRWARFAAVQGIGKPGTVVDRASVPHPGNAPQKQAKTLSGRGTKRHQHHWTVKAIAAIAGIAAAWAALVFVPHVKEGYTTASPVATQRSYTTERGQRADFDLFDGTHVVLGPASHLTINGDESRERHVTLYGQAYFEVIHNQDKPFTVMAGDATVRVLGTAFTVQSMRNDVVEVVVASGRVAMEGDAAIAPVVLTAATVGRMDASRKIHVERDVNIANYVGWIDGRIRFDNARVDHVITELSRWYNLDITLADERQRTQMVNATFGANETPEQVVRALGFMLGLKAKWEGVNVTLVGTADGSPIN